MPRLIPCLKLSFLLLSFFILNSSQSQSYQEQINAEKSVYFFPIQTVHILTSFESSPDWSELSIKDRIVGTEFQLPSSGSGPAVVDVAYVENLDNYLLEKFNNQIFELFKKHLPSTTSIVNANQRDMDPSDNYFYLEPLISSDVLMGNGFILFKDYDGFIQTQITIGANLREHRPDNDPKVLGGANVYAFVKESTKEDIERGISSPVLKGVKRAKNKYSKKFDKAFSKIKARVDKKLPEKLSKPR